jgi:hypothetical protein
MQRGEHIEQAIIYDEPLSGVGIGSATDQDACRVVDAMRSIEEVQRVFVEAGKSSKLKRHSPA